MRAIHDGTFECVEGIVKADCEENGEYIFPNEGCALKDMRKL